MKTARPQDLDLSSILRRVADLAGVKRDAEIARALNLTPPALANAKARGSVPYARLIDFAGKNGVALEYLFWGRGAPRRRADEVDPHLFSRAAKALDAALRERKPLPQETRDLCAAMVYNDISSAPEAQLGVALERAVRRVVDLLKSLGAAARPQGLDEPNAIAQDRLAQARGELVARSRKRRPSKR